MTRAGSDSRNSIVIITAGYDHTILFWEALSGVCHKTLQYGDAQVNALQISPDKSYFAACGHPHVKLYDLQNPQPNPLATLEGHTGNVVCCGFQKEGKWLYTGGDDGTIRIWDLRPQQQQRKCLREFVHGSPVNTVALHPNQAELWSGDNKGRLRVWDLKANVCEEEFIPEDNVPIRSVCVSPCGEFIVAGNNDGVLFAWKIVPRRASAVAADTDPEASKDAAEGSGTDNAQQAASAGGSGSGATNPSVTVNGTAPRSGGSLAGAVKGSISGGAKSAGKQGVQQAEPTASRLVAVRSFKAHNKYVLKVVVSPNSLVIASTGADQLVKLWNSASFDLLRVLDGHTKWVWDAVFSADSNYLVTCSSDCSAKLWDVTEGEVIRTYSQHQKAVVCLAMNDF
eukprot:Nk52_evm2s166 gene=Nk52_evmTU2s166